MSTTTAQMRDLADAVADASVWSMDPAEAGATLVELTRLAAQVSELQARVAAHADTIHVGQDVGASSTANWLAHQTKTTRAAAYGAVRLGHDLEAHASTRRRSAGWVGGCGRSSPPRKPTPTKPRSCNGRKRPRCGPARSRWSTTATAPPTAGSPCRPTTPPPSRRC
ncbi:hypothetical protein FHU40_000406 [Nocardioides soli]|uniref:DUF222 domain-containing protein n=1 Tax=Nocardioides soli TaxID=1036020 RepID=A0A7W4VS37_9ACTN|nr:hypothetical protein [Nocardioides soli]